MIEIRRAVGEDAGLLTGIAHAAKRYWNYPDQWILLWRSELTVDEEYIAHHEVYVAECAAMGVGFAALAQDQEEAELEHMWVHPSSMGLGVGRALLERALQYCHSAGVRRLTVVSDPNAVGFYQKLGGVPDGKIEAIPAPRTLPILRFDLSAIDIVKPVGIM